MVEEQSAERGATQYTYDAVGNIVKQVSEGGLIFKYDYDNQNRMIKEVMKQNGVDRKVNRFIFDNCENGNGRLCKVVSDGNITKYAYNENGNYTKVATKYVGEDKFETTRYAYNENEQLEKLHYPTGLTVKYHRTDEGFIHKVTGQYDKSEDKTIFVIAKNIRFNPVSNNLTDLKFGNGLKLKQTYGSKQGLAKTAIYQDRNLLESTTYLRDETGKITSITGLDANDSKSFIYDDFGHLITEQIGADTESLRTISYNYDAVGNRLSRQELTKAKSYNFAPDANRLDQINQKHLSYDVRGNLLEDNKGKRSFEYDVTNRMTAFYKNGELKASYGYNAYGQRISKTLHRNSDGEDSYTTLHSAYTPEGWLLSENGKSSSNNRTFARDYVWLGNRPLAQIDRKIRPDGTTRKARISYLHTDHLNTPRSASDKTGEIVWNWKSDAFGQGKANRDVDGDGNKTVIRLRFPGQYYDRESGLFYNHHRDYDPKLGRYIQSDPIGLNGGINRYAYVGNDPVNYIDRTGLSRTAQLRECEVTVIVDSDGNEIPGSAIRTCSGGGNIGPAIGGGYGNSGFGNIGSSIPGFNPTGGGSYTQYADANANTNDEMTDECESDPDCIVVTAQINREFTDGTRIRFNGRDEQPFYVTPDGIFPASGDLYTPIIQRCSDGSVRDGLSIDPRAFAGAEYGGHTHLSRGQRIPGPEDGVLARVLDAAYVITPNRVFRVDSYISGLNGFVVTQLSGPPLTSSEEEELYNTIVRWNNNNGGSGVTCTTTRL